MRLWPSLWLFQSILRGSCSWHLCLCSPSADVLLITNKGDSELPRRDPAHISWDTLTAEFKGNQGPFRSPLKKQSGSNIIPSTATADCRVIKNRWFTILWLCNVLINLFKVKVHKQTERGLFEKCCIMQQRAESDCQLLWEQFSECCPRLSQCYWSQGWGSWPQSHDQRIFQSGVPNIAGVMRG